ncbi:MAG: class I SAM-dependent methyltransferase [Pseudomonadota bacterium]
MSDDVLRAYAQVAGTDFISRMEAISSAELLAPLIEYLPDRPFTVLDVGAGTGRDAAWFALKSCRVVAVEPVDVLREFGAAKHTSANIAWVKDTLPKQSNIVVLGQKFDTILLSAVWHHLDATERRLALIALHSLATEGGVILISFRHGTEMPTRPSFPGSIPETVEWAAQAGLDTIAEIPAKSVQRENDLAGVTWTWLVFRKRTKDVVSIQNANQRC